MFSGKGRRISDKQNAPSPVGVSRSHQYEAFLGIDLTASPKRSSAYAIIDAGGRLLHMGCFAGDDEAIALASCCQPSYVAIDAPLSFPLGLDCLEEGCPCCPISLARGKEGERELSRLGIPCFYTTKKSIIKSMVYRGIALKERLSALGLAVLEVYPYATKVILWGRPVPKKTSAKGMVFLSECLGTIIYGVPASIPNHDIADAILAAYTAYLHRLGMTVAVGDPEEGQIIVPTPKASP